VSISQPPGEGRGRSGSKPGSGSGTAAPGSGSRRPPSGNGRNGGQPGQRSGAAASGRQAPSAGNRNAQRNPSEKTAGNRQVNSKTVTKKAGSQRSGARPEDRAKPGAPRGSQQGRGSGKAPVRLSGGRRPSPMMLGLGAIFVVVIVVLVLVLVGTNQGTPAQKVSKQTAIQTANLVAQVTSVPESVFAKVGLPSEIVNYPAKIKSSQKPLTSKGLPVMLYMGAEYCPFCGAERWAMIMALSKFGTFTGLKTTYSSATDFAADTPTFTFYTAKFTSPYLVFEPYELATNQPAASGSSCNVNGYACLMIPPQSLYNLLESKAIAGSDAGSFPFMDFGNKLYQAGAGFEDQPLALQGYTYSQVASQLYDPSSAVAQAEVGSANYITAAICAITGNKPGNVCSAAYIKSAQKKAGIS
jgi:Domain of unknown function (DUF929)